MEAELEALKNGAHNLRPMPRSLNMSKGERTALEWATTPQGSAVFRENPEHFIEMARIQGSTGREVDRILGGHFVDPRFFTQETRLLQMRDEVLSSLHGVV